jgi:hypothetical protein
MVEPGCLSLAKRLLVTTVHTSPEAQHGAVAAGPCALPPCRLVLFLINAKRKPLYAASTRDAPAQALVLFDQEASDS